MWSQEPWMRRRRDRAVSKAARMMGFIAIALSVYLLGSPVRPSAGQVPPHNSAQFR